MIDIEAIKALAEAATPGPWVVIGAIVSDGSRGLEDRVRNAEFCSHARTDVPALVAEVEALVAEVERLRSLNGELTTALRLSEQEADEIVAECKANHG